MEIKILGPGCSNCAKLDAAVRKVVAEMELVATIEKIEDYSDIASFGVMSTPALAVDGQVLIAGRVPSQKQIKELIEVMLALK